MEKEKIRQIINDQQELFNKKDTLIERNINLKNLLKGNEIIVITGIRRCGKSSLLKIISKKLEKKFIHINFEDIRFTDFKTENFEHIEEIAGNDVIYLLDEVQNINQWERWVNNLYNKGIKVFVTGSNSSLLSSELSTYLTGRHKTIHLFPFSFNEFLKLKKIPNEIKTSMDKNNLLNAFDEYFQKGGFPLVLKNDDMELSKQYFEDIANKDIITRYSIKKRKEFNDLIVYLFSNVGQIYSYSTLKRISGIGSLSVIKNYIDYIKNVFLGETIPKFDYSIKKQKIASSKFYSLDNSFLKTIAFNFSKNKGKRLENLVLIELIRRNLNVFYHLYKNECDFIIKKDLKIINAIQVCFTFSKENKTREIKGLIEAMRKYKLKKGLILTYEQEEKIIIDDLEITVKPVWKWLLESD